METEAREISRAQCIDFTSIPQLRRVCLIDYFHWSLDTSVTIFNVFERSLYFQKTWIYFFKNTEKNSNIGKYFHN